MGIRLGDVGPGCRFLASHVDEDGALAAPTAEEGKPALGRIEPKGTGRPTMRMGARAFEMPAADQPGSKISRLPGKGWASGFARPMRADATRSWTQSDAADEPGAELRC